MHIIDSLKPKSWSKYSEIMSKYVYVTGSTISTVHVIDRKCRADDRRLHYLRQINPATDTTNHKHDAWANTGNRQTEFLFQFLSQKDSK